MSLLHFRKSKLTFPRATPSYRLLFKFSTCNKLRLHETMNYHFPDVGKQNRFHFILSLSRGNLLDTKIFFESQILFQGQISSSSARGKLRTN